MIKRTRSDSPTRYCQVAGCGQALRARGMCANHYNQVMRLTRGAQADLVRCMRSRDTQAPEARAEADLFHEMPLLGYVRPVA